MYKISAENSVQIFGTIILLLSLPIIRFITSKLVLQYARMRFIMEFRAKVVVKYICVSLNILVFILLIVLWGVNPRNILVTLSSIFAVIGVALFAQWSILSNITAGIILFFTVPFKIGDQIRVLEKECPIEATITDIKAFHTHLRTNDGEHVIIPNNQLLQKSIAVINYSNSKVSPENFT